MIYIYDPFQFKLFRTNLAFAAFFQKSNAKEPTSTFPRTWKIILGAWFIFQKKYSLPTAHRCLNNPYEVFFPPFTLWRSFRWFKTNMHTLVSDIFQPKKVLYAITGRITLLFDIMKLLMNNMQKRQFYSPMHINAFTDSRYYLSIIQVS